MPPMIARPALLLPLALALGCGAPQLAGPPEGPPRASLEIVNRTPIAADVSVEGWYVGSVPGGERRRFHELTPGQRSVEARAAHHEPIRQVVSLLAGRTTLWTLLPSEGDPRPEPPPLGALLLVNAAGRDLEVRLDGQLARTLPDGDRRLLADTSAGPHELTLTVPGTHYRRTLTLTVEEAQTTAATLTVETGAVEVKNATGESVAVIVDGVSRATVPDKSATRLDGLLVGVHPLVGRGLDSRKEHARTLRVPQGEVIPWDLAAAAGRLVLVNRAGEALDVGIDDAAAGRIADAGRMEISDVRLGLRRVVATGVRTGYRWTADVPVSPGHEVTWTLRDDVGTLRVRNGLTEALQVQVDGEVKGIVQPSEELFIADLHAGEHALTVAGERSHCPITRKVTLGPERSALWDVKEPEGAVRVLNRTKEAVEVYSDGRHVGHVGAEDEIVFTQVPTGERLLEAVGNASGEVVRATVEVVEARVVTFDVAVSTVLVNVVNESGEVLLAPPGLRPQGEDVATGTSRVYGLPIGNRVLHFIGQRSGQSYFTRMTLTAQDHRPREWVVHPLEGAVQVFNQTEEPQSVQVDGEPRVVVPAGKDRLIRVSAGPHRLVAIGERSSDAIEGSLLVRAEATHPFEIRPRLGTIRVQNLTSETLDLRLGDQPLGFVAAGGITTYGPWSPGRRHLAAQGRWSHVIYEVDVEVAPGRREVWEIQPARGALLVRNLRDEDMRVVVDAEARGTAIAHGELRIEVPLGFHVIELFGKDTQALFERRMRVRADRTYTLDAPAGPASLVVRNHLPTALELMLDERSRGTVPAGGEVRIPIRELGRVTVYARVPGEKARFQRRLVFDDDREQTWDIGP